MFHIKIVENRIVFSSREAESKFNRLLSSFNNTGKTLSVTIEEYSRNTTIDQMKLLKAIVIAGKEYTGMTYSEFENNLIDELAPYKYINDILGQKVKQRILPAEMDQKQFQSFIQESVRFMNEFFDMNFILQE